MTGRDDRRLEKTKTPGVYRRGDSYVVVFSDARGKQRKRCAATYGEARVVKAKLTADVARGEYRDRSTIRFADYAAAWIEQYQGRTSRGFRDATRADYRRALERHAVPFLGTMRMGEIEMRDIKALARKVASTGVAPRTVKLALAPVHALFATAVEEGILRHNPASGLRIAQTPTPDADRARAKALTTEELRRFLEVVEPEWRLLFELLAQSGLRISEALALRWSDVDLGRRRVVVRRALVRGTFAAPKSRYAARQVPITEPLAEALRTARGPETAVSDALVFSRRDGSAIDRTTLHHAVLKPAARAAGVEWAAFHAFRHTCASLLFANGWNAVQVQRMLGHHSPAFTLATYIHLLDDELPEPSFLVDVIRPRGNAGATRGAETSRDREGTLHHKTTA